MTPAPAEKSHPLLWTAGLLAATLGLVWIFAHWFQVGARHGHEEGAVQLSPATVVEADHKALIADRGPAVIEQGRQLYAKNCASCHGPNGDTNASGTNPAPRNFHTEAFQAAWGGGPYGFYLTLSKGYGQGMPAFATLEPAQRYAVTHFIRETWVKGGANYLAEDAESVAAQIPKSGGGAVEGPRTPPELVDQPRNLHPLMASVSAEEQRRQESARTWLATVAKSAEVGERPLVARIRVAAERHPGWLVDLATAAAAGDAQRLAALVVADASGDPALALAPAASISVVVRVMMSVPASKGP